jgi:hypothetical protein
MNNILLINEVKPTYLTPHHFPRVRRGLIQPRDLSPRKICIVSPQARPRRFLLKILRLSISNSNLILPHFNILPKRAVDSPRTKHQRAILMSTNYPQMLQPTQTLTCQSIISKVSWNITS